MQRSSAQREQRCEKQRSDREVLARYDAWGEITQETLAPGYVPVPFGYGGGLLDRDTGLVRFGARDYDPRTGRWTAKDPIRFDGGDTNLFAYVGNDPVDLVDPEGRIVPVLVAVAGALGTASPALLYSAGALAASAAVAAGGSTLAMLPLQAEASRRSASDAVSAAVVGTALPLAGAVASLGLGASSAPVVCSAVLRHPGSIPDFLSALVVEGPPPLTRAGLRGFVMGEVVEVLKR